MYRPGHYGAALLVYAPVGFLVVGLGFRWLAVAGGGAAILLAMLPDYDRRLPFLTHRGLTHTAYFAALIGLLGALAGGLVGATRGPLAMVGLAAFGGVVGAGTIASHIAADALTPAGVAPFHGERLSYDVARSDSALANYGLLGLGLGLAVAALLLGTWVAGGA